MRVTSILQGASAGISVVSFENSLVDWNVKWRSTILMIDLACDCRKVAHVCENNLLAPSPQM